MYLISYSQVLYVSAEILRNKIIIRCKKKLSFKVKKKLLICSYKILKILSFAKKLCKQLLKEKEMVRYSEIVFFFSL